MRTPPIHKDISYEKVATVALDMFVDTSQAVSAPEPKVQAVSAADEEETITPKDKPSLLESIAALPKIPWRIPQKVERGYEIPICVTENYRLEIGKFCRLGMDIVVNAVWLAYSWAKEEGTGTAVSALRSLILDWPMDFVLIRATSPEELEEKKFTWNVNMGAKIERLREYVGLDNMNLMRIIAKAKEITSAKLPGGKKASPAAVHEWLGKNINWGIRRCPKVEEVDHHLRNWEKIRRIRRPWNSVRLRFSGGGAIIFWTGRRK